MDYTTRTRQDWLDFDNSRRQAFLPTEQEIELEKQRIKLEKQTLLNEKMTSRGIEIPEEITRKRCLGLLKGINAQEYIGKDLGGWLDSQKELYGSYEEAFKELALKYL